MIRNALAAYVRRVRAALGAAFLEDHTPHEVAVSFAVGVFITALPSLGLGVGLFFVLVHVWTWMSKTAMFASVVVLNPFVKPAVYVASYNVGAFLFGTSSVDLFELAALNWALTAIKNLLLGNVLVAVFLALCGYGLVFELARTCHRRDAARFESAAD